MMFPGLSLRSNHWAEICQHPRRIKQRMRKPIIIFFVCLLLPVAVHAQTVAPSQTALKTALQLKLDEWHKAGSFPGATLGVVLANGESFGLAVGVSDRETKRP